MAGDEDDHMCPCCRINVLNDDKALQCDGFCNLWYHCACVDISDNDHDKINDLSDKVRWYCGPCADKLSRIVTKSYDFEDVLTLHTMVKQLINVTKGISSDNVGISRRMDLVTQENDRLGKEVMGLKEVLSKKVSISASETVLESRRSTLDIHASDESHTSLSYVSKATEEVKDSCKETDITETDRENDFYDSTDVGNEVNFSNNGNRKGKGWNEVNYRKNRGRGSRRGQYNRVYSNSNNQVRQSNYSQYDRPRPTLDHTREFNSQQSNAIPKATPTQRRFSDVVKSNVKNKVLHGTKEVGLSDKSSLKTVKKMFWLFLSGLDPEVDTDAVVAYLNGLSESKHYSCEKLNARYDTYCSFKVGVPYELGDGLLDPKKWPQGCVIGKYRSPRNKPAKDSDPFLDQNRLTTGQV